MQLFPHRLAMSPLIPQLLLPAPSDSSPVDIYGNSSTLLQFTVAHGRASAMEAAENGPVKVAGATLRPARSILPHSGADRTPCQSRCLHRHMGALAVQISVQRRSQAPITGRRWLHQQR